MVSIRMSSFTQPYHPLLDLVILSVSEGSRCPSRQILSVSEGSQTGAIRLSPPDELMAQSVGFDA
jgi:hypothetical protein